MDKLRKVGAHRIIQAYFFGFVLWGFVLVRLPSEWGGPWTLLLILASAILILSVVFGDVGSTWNDKE